MVNQSNCSPETRASDRAAGAALVALGVGFNIPFVLLAVQFDYPEILRRPAAEILSALVAGGPGLLLVWYAFALAALLFAPVALAHALAADRSRSAPALAISAGIFGALAGVMQAAGLLRWVLVVPLMSGQPAGDTVFTAVHAFGGALMGEHLGQLLTAGHIAIVAMMQRRERRRFLARIGFAAAAAIAIGAYETVAIALGFPGETFGQVAVAGYMGLTLWMVASGADLMRRRSSAGNGTQVHA